VPKKSRNNFFTGTRHQTKQVDNWKHYPQIKNSYEECRWKSNHKNQKNCNKETIYVYNSVSFEKEMYNLCNEPPWMITVLNWKRRLHKKQGITTKENLETVRSNNLIVDNCQYNTKPLFYMAIGS
jgi:hypothetical protein